MVTLAEIFRFKETGYDKNRKVIGQFQATGTVPSFVQEIKDRGVHIPMEIFSNESPAPKAVATSPTNPPPGTNPNKKAG